jgi:hypothetical protein
MTTSDLMKAIRAASPNAVAGYIAGGLLRNIRKAALKNDDVIVAERWGGMKTYKAGRLLFAHELPPKTR